MCGINGIFGNSEVVKIELRIKSMNDSIKHRGPDADEFVSIKDKIAVGHRRLSIIDLDNRSNQPMYNNNGNFLIVFNGEIFNYLDIKKELINSYNFITNSDTEVILAAYEIKGIDWLLDRANGMFAFAIYDLMNNNLTLVRDRFGIKPLFYSIVNNTLIFSSEIKGILSSGLVEAKFNISAIDEYLGNRYIREPFTFFENIFQVKSGTYITYQSNLKFTERKYWSLPLLNFATTYDENQLIKETQIEIENAVKRWSIADVKLGAYLSGGVDSSLMCAILAKSTKNKIDTYTIGFQEEKFNEFQYAKEIADLYLTNHREFLIGVDEYFAEWEELIYFKDAPLGVPNEIPLAIMSSKLSKDITVVISGEGADELFGGYGKIYRAAFDFNNHNPTIEGSFYKYFINQYEYVPREIRDKYLKYTVNYRNHFDEEIMSDFTNYSNEENIFRFFQNYHLKGLLNRVDMTTMQTAVEARPPFLDHVLIEFVYNKIPYALKLKWNSEENENRAKIQYAKEYSEILDTPKYILKKVAENLLPHETIYRKKMGFPVPLVDWLPKLKILSNKILKKTDWLKPAVLNELYVDLEKNEKSGQLLWMFLNIELFRSEYFSKEWRW